MKNFKYTIFNRHYKVKLILKKTDNYWTPIGQLLDT